MRIVSRKVVLGCGAAIAVLVLATGAQAQQRTFNVPAEEAVKAIPEFARQAGIQIIAPASQLRGVRTPVVRGDLDTRQALALLLQGTGLEIASDNGSVITLRRSSDRPRAEALDTAEGEPTVVEAVTVTGSNIRSDGASIGTDVRVLTRDDIDRGGFASVEQVIQSLPQQQTAQGATDNQRKPQTSSNMSFASGVNLRGIGSSSTLVLLNGRRLAPTGFDSDYVDVSSIPVSAIDRIEVLPDGASAVYGADAVAGVVNIILRKSYDGAETRGRYGAATRGGLDDYQIAQSFGRSWTSGSALVAVEYAERSALSMDDRAETESPDLTGLGGADYRAVQTNPGNLYSLFTFQPTYGIPTGQDGTNLTPADLTTTLNRGNQNLGADYLPSSERASVFATIRQEVTPGFEVSSDFRFSRREYGSLLPYSPQLLFVTAANPFFVDPEGFGFAIVGYDMSRDIAFPARTGKVESSDLSLTGRFDLAADWQLRITGSRSTEDGTDKTPGIDAAALDAALADPNPATAFNPFGDGSFTNPATLAGLLKSVTSTHSFELRNLEAVADGALFTLPAGDVRAAIGAAYREEEFSYRQVDEGPLLYQPSARRIARRKVGALFAEVQVPVVSDANAVPGIRELKLSAAVRMDDYMGDKRTTIPVTGPTTTDSRVTGSTTNPKFALTWKPIDDLSFRATYGTSFRAPNLSTISALEVSGLTFFQDTGGGTTTTVYRAGFNPDLKNETSTTWTAGFDWRPAFAPDLTVKATYFELDFSDRIGTPADTTNILLNEDRYGSLITRNPSQAELDAICLSPGFQGNPASCVAGAVGAIVDIRTNNVARTQVRGLDFTGSYAWDLPVGRLTASTDLSYLFELSEQFGEGSATFSLEDTLGQPTRWKARSSLTWVKDDAFSASVFFNYVNSYENTTSATPHEIDAWATFDLSMTYVLPGRLSGPDAPASLSLVINNLFDEGAPFADNPAGIAHDPANSDVTGRYVSLSLVKRW